MSHEAAAVEEVNKGIADLYDEMTVVMETLWGDHMHHGFYDVGVPTRSLPDHQTAQIRMIEEALRFAGVSDDPSKKPKRILDVGCGIGGSSLYLAKKYGAKCHGINLSPFQIQRAQSLAMSAGLTDKVSFEIADAQNQPFPDGHFDLVWVLETAEHMPEKSKFIGELARVTAPGGIVIITSWCQRDLLPSEVSLRPDEVSLLNKLSESHHLPKWCSPSEYVKLAESSSFKDIKTADWTEHVAPHWNVAMRPVLTWKGITFILRSGWKMAKGLLAMPIVSEGREKKIIKYAILTFRKPE
uniref:Truncated N-methyltransferase n=1 Tax=Gloriosa superba TaxID=41220 RepID=A0A7D5U620_GLOSU|nr:truncated N-methyltransferase [Gloriosa superba]